MVEKKIKEYVCPKCKAKVTSSKPLKYCICGGKYSTVDADFLRKPMKDIFGEIF